MIIQIYLEITSQINKILHLIVNLANQYNRVYQNKVRVLVDKVRLLVIEEKLEVHKEMLEIIKE